MYDWRARWDALRAAVIARAATQGSTAEEAFPIYDVAPPASEDEVRAVEAELGCGIPPSLRRVLREFSARVHLQWWLEAGMMPEPLSHFWSGECRWDLNSLASVQRAHREWIEKTFTGKSSDYWPDKPPEMIEYDLVWHNKFPLLELGNGDMIGIDVASAAQPVVYLSHEGSYSHGSLHGADFEDYVDRISMLGFLGPEDANLWAFLQDPTAGLDVEVPLAREWRQWLGLRLTGPTFNCM